MSKKHKKVTRHRWCDTCPDCTYIGEGDFICDKGVPFIVKEDWIPSDFYNACKDKDLFEQAQSLTEEANKC